MSNKHLFMFSPKCVNCRNLYEELILIPGFEDLFDMIDIHQNKHLVKLNCINRVPAIVSKSKEIYMGNLAFLFVRRIYRKVLDYYQKQNELEQIKKQQEQKSKGLLGIFDNNYINTACCSYNDHDRKLGGNYKQALNCSNNESWVEDLYRLADANGGKIPQGALSVKEESDCNSATLLSQAEKLQKQRESILHNTKRGEKLESIKDKGSINALNRKDFDNSIRKGTDFQPIKEDYSSAGNNDLMNQLANYNNISKKLNIIN